MNDKKPILLEYLAAVNPGTDLREWKRAGDRKIDGRIAIVHAAYKEICATEAILVPPPMQLMAERLDWTAEPWAQQTFENDC